MKLVLMKKVLMINFCYVTMNQSLQKIQEILFYTSESLLSDY